METLLLSVEEAITALGIGRTTFYQLIDSGSLPTIKMGRRRMVKRSDLEAYVDTL